MSKQEPEVSTEQRDHINAVLAQKAPGTRFGPMKVRSARRHLTGEGFTEYQIDAMLELRRIEFKNG